MTSSNSRKFKKLYSPELTVARVLLEWRDKEVGTIKARKEINQALSEVRPDEICYIFDRLGDIYQELFRQCMFMKVERAAV